MTASRFRFAAVVLMGAVLASRVLGFARDAYIAAAFGANGATDAFYAAFKIPDLLNYLVAGGTLSITFIPIYTKYLTANDAEEGDRVFSTIATLMTIVITIGVIVLGIYTPPLAGWYLKKLRPEDLGLAIHLSRILLPAQVAFYVGGLASATLLARHRFVAVSCAPLLYNLGPIVGGVLFRHSLGVSSLAWGALGGAILGPLLVQVLAASSSGVRYRPRLDLSHPDVKRWLLLSLPLMVGVSLVTADDWIITYFAGSSLGAISQLNYARKLVWVPIAVAGQAIGQASMPFFARLFAEGKKVELAAMVSNAARSSAVVAALAAGGLAAVAVPTVDLLFRRGHFDATQVAPTALYVVMFAVAIPLWGLQGIIARAFYAAGDTLVPMAAGTLVTLAMVPLYALSYRSLGIPGLVLGSDLGILLHTAALMWLLPRRLPELQRGALLVQVLRGFAVAALAAAPAHLAAHYLPAGHLTGHMLDVARILVAGTVFATIALAIAGPMGVTDAGILIDKVRSRVRARLGR